MRLYASALLGMLVVPMGAWAGDIGQIKTIQGSVRIERTGQSLPATVGAAVQQSDRLVTGADGAVGIVFNDNALLSAGPNSVLELTRFSYLDTGPGAFDATLRKGTLSVISGKIAKQGPNTMQIKTPSTILGVRGTEFLVQADTGEVQ